MVDISKSFGNSYKLIVDNKKVVLPVLISLIIAPILFEMFLASSGLNPVLDELTEIQADYEKERATLKSDFTSYLKERGYSWDRFKELLNVKNFVLLGIFILAWMVVSFYLSCMSNAMIVLVMKKKKTDVSSLISATNKFLSRAVLLSLLVWIIVGIPILILAGIGALLFFFNMVVLGILTVILFIFVIVFYLVVVPLRLYFATPVMFIGDLGAKESIRKSWQLTRGRLFKVFLIFCVIFGVSILMSFVVSNPLQGIYSSLDFSSSPIVSSLNFLVAVILTVIEAFLVTFQSIFLFYAYLDFKNFKKQEA